MSKYGYRDLQFYKFAFYGFLKNQRFFEPFMMLYFLEAGQSYAAIGSLYGAKSLVSVLMEIPSGYAADVLGRRRTMIFSFLLYGLAFLLLWAGSSYGPLLAGMLLFGLADAFRTGTHKAMIYRHLDLRGMGDQKTSYYGRTRSWSQAGSAVSALIAGALVLYSGSFRVVFLFSIVPYAINALLIASYPRELEAAAAPSETGKEPEEKKVHGASRGAVRRLIQPGFLALLGRAGLHTGMYKSIKDYVQPAVAALALGLPLMQNFEARSRSAILAALVYSLFFILSAFSSRNADVFQRLWKSRRAALQGGLFTGIILAGLIGIAWLLQLIWLVIPGFLVLHALENLRKPAATASVADASPPSLHATAMSMESQAEGLFAALFALAAGAAAEAGGPGWGLLVTSLGALLLSTFLSLLKDPALNVDNG